MDRATLLSGSAARDPTPDSTQPSAHIPAAAHAASPAADLAEVAERQAPTQSPFVAERQARDAAGAQTDLLRAAKRQAVLRQVHAQREALALLSRNAPVPAQLLRDVGPPTADFDPEVHADEARAADDAAPGQHPTAEGADRQHSTLQHGAQPQTTKPQQPAGWPPDEEAVAAARSMAKRLAAEKLAARIAELEQLPGHIPADQRLRVLIELRGLRLAGVQRQMRAEVLRAGHTLASAAPDVPLEWRQWRRPPADPWGLGAAVAAAAAAGAPQHDPAELARQREAAEQAAARQQRAALEAEQQRRRGHHAAVRKRIDEARIKLAAQDAEAAHRREYLAALAAHQKDVFRPAAALAVKRRTQRTAAMRAWHIREARKVSRADETRLAALRDSNYEEYVRLAQEAKEGRLHELLEKTDAIIAELGTKARAACTFRLADLPEVQEQRAAATGAAAGADNGEREARPESEAERLLQGQRAYYNMVHTVREDVAVPTALQGGTLRPYQLDGLRFLLSLYNNCLNGVLADEMGLGKTVQTVALVAALAQYKGCTGPHLVLAPKAVLPNWATEFGRWLPGCRAVLYDGLPEERRALQREVLEQGAFSVCLTHYDLAMRDRAALRKIGWEVLVVDEGHRLKNADSKLVEVLRGFTFHHRVLLTGTPLQNTLGELWALLNFLLPKVFDSADTFDEWFAAPFQGQAEHMREALKEEEQLLIITRLHQVIRPFMLRRTKLEVEKELPSKTAVVIKCGQSAWQSIIYSQISDQGKVTLESKALRSLHNIAMQLRKACNHPYMFLEGPPPDELPTAAQPAQAAVPQQNGVAAAGAHTDADGSPVALQHHAPGVTHCQLIRASGKLVFLAHALPKLRAAGHRVLLFSQMTRALDLIGDTLAALGLPFLRLDGSTKTEQRAAMLTDFNAEGSAAFCFLLSTRAGGLGLNLQTADTVIMFDSDWNPAMDAQAEDRAHRIGQKKAVLVLVLATAGTIEEAILARASQKRSLDAKVIQAGMFNDKSTAAERQAVLQALLRRGAQDAAGSPHTPEELNRLLARSPEELQLFSDMDVTAPPPEPLAASEVPDWVTRAASPIVVSDHEGENGTGGRKRRRAAAANGYAGLSDGAFDELLGSSEDEESSSGADGSDSSASPAPAQRIRKRGRQEQSAAASSPSDDDEEPLGAASQRRSGKRQRSRSAQPGRQQSASAGGRGQPGRSDSRSRNRSRVSGSGVRAAGSRKPSSGGRDRSDSRSRAAPAQPRRPSTAQKASNGTANAASAGAARRRAQPGASAADAHADTGGDEQPNAHDSGKTAAPNGAFVGDVAPQPRRTTRSAGPATHEHGITEVQLPLRRRDAPDRKPRIRKPDPRRKQRKPSAEAAAQSQDAAAEANGAAATPASCSPERSPDGTPARLPDTAPGGARDHSNVAPSREETIDAVPAATLNGSAQQLAATDAGEAELPAATKAGSSPAALPDLDGVPDDNEMSTEEGAQS